MLLSTSRVSRLKREQITAIIPQFVGNLICVHDFARDVVSPLEGVVFVVRREAFFSSHNQKPARFALMNLQKFVKPTLIEVLVARLEPFQELIQLLGSANKT